MGRGQARRGRARGGGGRGRNAANDALEGRRRCIARLLQKGYSKDVLRAQIHFPRPDAEDVIREYRLRNERHEEEDGEGEGENKPRRDGVLTSEEAEFVAGETLRALGPKPFPLMSALRELVEDPSRSRREELEFRCKTELRMDMTGGVQRLWTINSNVQFHLGVKDINLHAWGALLSAPFYYNNACFRSLDLRMRYAVDGMQHSMNVNIFSHGSVVMIGVTPLYKASECAHMLVEFLRSRGMDCHVLGLKIQNIVVGFDLGANLNLEEMSSHHPAQMTRHRYLPMYTYRPPGEKRPVAFLFRTGCGLIPGAHDERAAIEFFHQIHADSRAYLYHGTSVVNDDDVQYVGESVLPSDVGIAEVMNLTDPIAIDDIIEQDMDSDESDDDDDDSCDSDDASIAAREERKAKRAHRERMTNSLYQFICEFVPAENLLDMDALGGLDEGQEHIGTCSPVSDGLDERGEDGYDSGDSMYM